MTTDFRAGDPGSGNGSGATSFQAAGAAAPGSGTPEDTTVVLEHGGRKFTKSDLVKKLDHADTHIGTLTTELKDQRTLLDQVNETLKKQVGVAELLKEIKEGKGFQPAPAAPASASAPALTTEDVVKLVQDTNRKQASEAQQSSNWNEVTTTLTKAFGDKTNQKVAAVAAEHGITLDEAVKLAKSAPKAFLKLFSDIGSEAKPSAMPSSGRVNTQAFNAPQGQASGFHKATSTKQSVEIYLNRLKQLGL